MFYSEGDKIGRHEFTSSGLTKTFDTPLPCTDGSVTLILCEIRALYPASIDHRLRAVLSIQRVDALVRRHEHEFAHQVISDRLVDGFFPQLLAI